MDDSKFSLSEIHNMMRDILISLNTIYKSGDYHGTVSTDNIFYSYEKFKLCDNSHFGKHPLYLQVLSNNEHVAKNIYLAPQLIQGLKMFQENPRHNPEKSDIFSLGIVLIEICRLNKNGDCFDYLNFRVNFGQITHRIVEITKNYSEILSNTINLMINSSEDLRPNCENLLKLFESEI